MTITLNDNLEKTIYRSNQTKLSLINHKKNITKIIDTITKKIKINGNFRLINSEGKYQFDFLLPLSTRCMYCSPIDL